MRRQHLPKESPHGDGEEHPSYEEETLPQGEAEDEELAENLEREALKDDYVPGAVETAEEVGDTEAPLEIPRGELETCEADVVEAEEELRRANAERVRILADFDNFRKRAQNEKRDAISHGKEVVLESLLPVLDNFDRAMEAARSAAEAASKAGKSAEYQALLEGVRLIQRQLHDVLTRHDVHAIKAVGQPFDPHLHEAIGHLETREHPEGTVVQEVRKGFKHGDTVLRHSQVMVAAHPGKK
jgi:molecular chaperone GrpE